MTSTRNSSLLNYYKISAQVLVIVKDLYTSLSNSGLRIAPGLKSVYRSLQLSLYREISFKSDEEHIQLCVNKVMALLTRLQHRELTIRDLTNAMKPYNIYIVSSKAVTVTIPKFNKVKPSEKESFT